MHGRKFCIHVFHVAFRNQRGGVTAGFSHTVAQHSRCMETDSMSRLDSYISTQEELPAHIILLLLLLLLHLFQRDVRSFSLTAAGNNLCAPASPAR